MSFKVVGIGEVLWDLLPSGSHVGGAPANFACHAHALGASACVVTRIGRDALGEAIFRRFQEEGIADGTVQVDDLACTGVVTVTLSSDGVPVYKIRAKAAWDRLEAVPAALEAVREADAVCFGSLAQRSLKARSAIHQLVAASKPSALRVFDINLRQSYFSRKVLEQSLRLANVLKLNDGELVVLANLFGLKGSMRDQIEQLAGDFDLDLVACTRGPGGSLLFQAGRWSDCPSKPVRVVDTVGAGDAFTAALVMGLLTKMDLDEINLFADEVAVYVCTCQGATPPLPKRFLQRLDARHLPAREDKGNVVSKRI